MVVIQNIGNFVRASEFSLLPRQLPKLSFSVHVALSLITYLQSEILQRFHPSS